jgi:hypothetical protein
MFQLLSLDKTVFLQHTVAFDKTRQDKTGKLRCGRFLMRRIFEFMNVTYCSIPQTLSSLVTHDTVIFGK